MCIWVHNQEHIFIKNKMKYESNHQSKHIFINSKSVNWRIKNTSSSRTISNHQSKHIHNQDYKSNNKSVHHLTNLEVKINEHHNQILKKKNPKISRTLKPQTFINRKVITQQTQEQSSNINHKLKPNIIKTSKDKPDLTSRLKSKPRSKVAFEIGT